MPAPALTSEVIDKIAAKMAELTISGVGINKQVQLLNEEFDVELNSRRITKYRKREIYQRIMNEYTEGLVKNAIAELKRETSQLIPLVIGAIKKALEEGNLQAVPHALRILGVGEESKEAPSQSLTVVLPGMKQEKDVSSN